MATTNGLPQKGPDFYTNIHQCKEAARLKKKGVNPRYFYFSQNHYTAGDEEQFESHRDATNGNVCIESIDVSNNLFVDQPFPTWNKYKDVEAVTVINTFRYIFNKFKKGIFIKIKNNKLVVFLPFSKANFVNEWSSKILIDPKYKNLHDFLLNTLPTGYRYDPRRVNTNVNEWYANNCIVRYDINPYTKKPNEGDSNVGTIKNMIEELCKKRHVPDIEFFFNRRDFPIITRDSTEPYDNIWGNIPLVSHNFPKYIPIMSMCNTNKYADILSPTHEDWARVQNKKGIFFPRSCRKFQTHFNTPWEDKKKTAVFRGTSTGCGTTIDSNPRLKLAHLSATQDSTIPPLLDAGITKWNRRPRKLKGSKYLQTIDISKLGIKLSKFLSPQQQSTYRYIINVDGHVSAFRLSTELSMGSVILSVQSKWKIWYSDMLIPYKHYVPVKSDLSDLLDKIKWCRNNDEKCKIIANNALEFYNTYLQENGILDYLQKTIVDMKSEMGVYLYNINTPLQTQIHYERQSLDLEYPTTNKTTKNIHEIPWFSKRSIGLLKGVQWIVRMSIKENNFFSTMNKDKHIFSNKLGTITKYTLGGEKAKSFFPMAVKTTSDTNKIKEHIHEAFIGTKVINSIVKDIPNFAYTFALNQNDKQVSLINEFIQGQTLIEYLQSNRFNFNNFLSIIAQLCLSLQVAQNTCGFVHYDMVPWNIILQYSKDAVVDYVISPDNIVRVKTNMIPVIIDYGKSHVIFNGKHHGFINMFKASSIQDVLSLLLTSLQIIISKQNLGNKINNLLILANFITGTTYRKDKFTSIKELRKFLKTATKYSTMCYSNKYELEQKTPMDLFKWIYKIGKHGKYSFIKSYKKIKSPTNFMNKGNGRQIFDYILSNTIEEKAQTYFKFFSRLKHCTIPQPDNLFFVYYAVQSLYDNVNTVNEEMEYFLRSTSQYRPLKSNLKNKTGQPIPYETYKLAYNDACRYLEKVYRPKIKQFKQEKINYIIEGDFSNLELANYTQEMFLEPNKIFKLLKTGKNMNNLIEARHIIISVLLYKGLYELTNDNKEHYIKNFATLLKINPFIMENNSANLKTLKFLSEKIYTQDITFLEQKLPGTGDCTDAKKYLKDYRSILDLLR